MMRRFLLLSTLLLLAAGCDNYIKEVAQEEGQTVLNVSLPEGARTHMGPSVEGTRRVFWSDGDQMALNGVTSAPLSGIGEEASSAVFSFSGVINPPYNLLYPASFYDDAGHITLPEQQTYAAGSFADATAPLAGYAESAADISLGHLCAVLLFPVKKDPSVSASNLSTLKFKGNNSEQVCGQFAIDYAEHTLTADGSGAELTLNIGQALSESVALDLYLVVPAGTYSKGFTVELEDASGRTMTKIKRAGITLSAGALVKMPAFSFLPSPEATEFSIPDIIEDYIEPDDYNITGRVVDSEGNGISNVVVSDGRQCVQTMVDGKFFMTSNVSDVKFVQISTPSGYLPPVDGGKPRFYKALASITPSGGIYDCGDFVLTPVANPDTYTLFITADLQPRATNIPVDNVAYRSTRACEALYQDLQETAAAVSGRQVYGISLGDLVHENMDLMGTYSDALGSLGFPTYNIIGNHDYDINQADDDAGAWKYESLFGPRNYSFNIGGIHFLMLDNLIMKKNGSGSSAKLTAYDHGLTDEIWEWMQADMSFVPKSTTIMACAHSPLFKCDNGSERTNTSKHGGHNQDEGYAYGYGTLLDEYDEVHAWAGHTHTGFNYIYPPTHRNKNVQVHTLARSTGELWTNEYLANGTPRGFTIVEVVDGEVASWRFHPTKYLKSNFHGTNGQPAYTYCDWTFVNDGNNTVARMKDTGADLDESYQMHVFAPNAYGDGKLYVNVFLWDSLWQLPTLTMAGGSPVTMEHVEDVSVAESERTGYDIANKEIIDFYNANYSSTLSPAGYKPHSPGLPLTMFRVDAPSSGTGTVSVTDRFGNTYSRTVSW